MWQEVLSVLFPKRCINCDLIIPFHQKFVCESCSSVLPFTGIPFSSDNYLKEKINNHVKIEYASSLLIFKKNNITQKLVHYLKYKNCPEIGSWMAEIWFELNKNNSNLKQIDYVVPVPIHYKRFEKRTYNQIELCAETLSKLLNCTYEPQILKRIYHLDSQTNSGKWERLQRIQGAFQKNISKKGHFLLVDDVLTTGATLIACATELLKTEETKISIFTLSSAQ
ncbi:ComF family protein [Apibacter raozihei]|uniref:ComF family protein n=1 Tax=Apibacter raozihei TaxID=2500547 RepID=UPI000FE39809|nr:ComF family protein [Apibacter raozihei]